MRAFLTIARLGLSFAVGYFIADPVFSGTGTGSLTATQCIGISLIALFLLIHVIWLTVVVDS